MQICHRRERHAREAAKTNPESKGPRSPAGLRVCEQRGLDLLELAFDGLFFGRALGVLAPSAPGPEPSASSPAPSQVPLPESPADDAAAWYAAVETRNQAEALSFQAERAIKDLGDKVSSEDKLEVENKIETLREALKGSDMEAVKAGMSSLAESLQRVSTAAYQAAASAAGESGNGSSDGTGDDSSDGAGSDGAEPAEGEAEEETVEGEFKEV